MSEETNVVSVHGGPVPMAKENSPALIGYLEELLEQAKSGEILGMAAATMYRDRTTAYSVVGVIEGFSMVGALEMAKATLVNLDLETRE